MNLSMAKIFVSICVAITQLSCTSAKVANPEKPIEVAKTAEKEREPIAAAPVVEEPKQEKPKAEEPKTEEAKAEELKAEEKKEPDYKKIAETYPKTPFANNAAVGLNDSKSWWFKRTDSGNPPGAQMDIATLKYDAYHLGDTSRKVIYLTFDEGYEMGYSDDILDTLKENDVKAAFFVTQGFMKDQPELTKRMADEGHVVANHSVTHPQMSHQSDQQILKEINGCAEYYKNLTGKEMAPFFRPPAGEYSIRTLEKTKEAGYKTIFWSFAYKDWVVDEQPGKENAYNTVMKYSHNGCIMLLHAVSESNTQALDSMLKDLKKQGYTFESLYELPKADKLLEAMGNK